MQKVARLDFSRLVTGRFKTALVFCHSLIVG